MKKSFKILWMLMLCSLTAVALACLFACSVLLSVLEDDETSDSGTSGGGNTGGSGNQNSVDALNYGVISAALYAVAIIVCVVSGGFDFVTSIRKRRTREDIIEEINVLKKELASMPGSGTDVFNMDTDTAGFTYGNDKTLICKNLHAET